MSTRLKILAPLNAILRFTGALVAVICVFLFRPLSWAIALLFVGLSCGACTNQLSVWPAIVCFAVGVSLHCLVLIPTESLERHLRLQKKRDHDPCN